MLSLFTVDLEIFGSKAGVHDQLDSLPGQLAIEEIYLVDHKIAVLPDGAIEIGTDGERRNAGLNAQPNGCVTRWL